MSKRRPLQRRSSGGEQKLRTQGRCISQQVVFHLQKSHAECSDGQVRWALQPKKCEKLGCIAPRERQKHTLSGRLPAGGITCIVVPRSKVFLAMLKKRSRMKSLRLNDQYADLNGWIPRAGICRRCPECRRRGPVTTNCSRRRHPTSHCGVFFLPVSQCRYLLVFLGHLFFVIS